MRSASNWLSIGATGNSPYSVLLIFCDIWENNQANIIELIQQKYKRKVKYNNLTNLFPTMLEIRLCPHDLGDNKVGCNTGPAQS